MKSSWLPSKWQEYSHQLLNRHYTPSHWNRVPDQHTGDAGIEGFSSSGHAYQCYAPQGSLDVAELYEKHRKKTYVDTEKFMDNKQRLQRIFGAVLITRWNLFVPDHVSAELLPYCDRRRKKILAAALPYVNRDDFFVKVLTPDDFPVEVMELASSGIGRITFEIQDVTPEEVAQWRRVSENASQLTTLKGKLTKLPSLGDSTRRTNFERNLMKKYLHGQKLLHQLKDEYPDLFEEVRVLRARREGVLELESQIGETSGATLTAEVNRMTDELSEDLSALRPHHHAELGLHAVADWLLRCPLDFPGHDTA